MLKNKIVIISLIMSIILVGGVGIVSAEDSVDKPQQYIVEGEENVKDNHKVIRKLDVKDTTYFLVEPQGISTLDSENDPNIYENSKVEIIEPVSQESSDISVQNSDVWWNMKNINAESLPSSVKNNLNNVDISILDTGIDEDHNYLNTEKWEKPEGSSTGQDHGTHVAGIITAEKNPSNGVKGVAPGADFYDMKILGQPKLFDLAWAIRDAAEGPDLVPGSDDDAEVISMSVRTENTEVIRDTISSYHPETTFIAAAGNERGAGVVFPAKHPDVIAVSAVDRSNNFAGFSSSGPEVDLAAPGENVLSLANGGGYTQMSGTSMSAPHVSGAVAALIASDSYSENANVIEKKLEMSATGGSSNRVGAGVLNVERLLEVEIKPKVRNIQPNTVHLTSNRNQITFTVTQVEAGNIEYYYDITPVGVEPDSYKIINEKQFTIDTSKYTDDSNIEVHIKAVNERGKVGTKSKQYQIANTPEADLSVNSINIPKTMQPGQTKNIDLILENKGAATGTFRGQLNISGNIREVSETVQYESQKAVEIPLSFDNPGEKQLRFTSSNPSIDKSKELMVINSDFSVSTFTLSSQEIEKPGHVTATIVLSNANSNPIDTVGYVQGEGLRDLKYINHNVDGNGETRIVKELFIEKSTNVKVSITDPDGIKDKNRYVQVKGEEDEVNPRPPEPPEQPPDLEDNLSINSFEANDRYVRVGEEFEVRLAVENTGGRLGIYNGELQLNGNPLEEISRTVQDGEETVITREFSFDKTGENTIKINSYNSDVGNREITINVKDVRLNVDNLNVSSESVNSGESFDVSITVSNSGEEESNIKGDIQFSTSNKTVSVNEVISGNTTETITEEVTLEQTGNTVVKFVPDEITIDTVEDTINVKEKTKNVKLLDFYPSKTNVNVGEEVELNVKLENTEDEFAAFFGEITYGSNNKTTQIIKLMHEQGIHEDSQTIKFSESGNKTIHMKTKVPRGIRNRTVYINVSGGEFFGFEDPLLTEFKNPPQNTGELDPNLYEDLDGDGETSDIKPAVLVFRELVINEEEFKNTLTEDEKKALDWNNDGVLNHKDMVELYEIKKENYKTTVKNTLSVKE